jgi:hypothetical protein
VSESSLVLLAIGVVGALVVLHAFALNRRESDLMLDTYTRMLNDARAAQWKQAEAAARAAAGAQANAASAGEKQDAAPPDPTA